jgi:hypothetical protein
MPACHVTRLRIYVSNNTVTLPSTFTIRNNGVATPITLTVPISGTGAFVATGSVSFADGDLLSVQGIIGNNGVSINVSSIIINYAP